MAQFLQKLAGWTDSQTASRYQNASTIFTDIRYLLPKGFSAESPLEKATAAEAGCVNEKSTNAEKKPNLPRYYAILWLAGTGVTFGCHDSGTKFCPEQSVNRGAMAEFMQRFSGVTNVPSSTSLFPDVSTTKLQIKYGSASKATQVAGLSKARIGAINWLDSTKITLGSGTAAGKTTYKPHEAVNRGAMAEFMHKLANFLSKQ